MLQLEEYGTLGKQRLHHEELGTQHEKQDRPTSQHEVQVACEVPVHEPLQHGERGTRGKQALQADE
jgi:hypothetical protein